MRVGLTEVATRPEHRATDHPGNEKGAVFATTKQPRKEEEGDVHATAKPRRGRPEGTVGTLLFPPERASCSGVLGARNDRRLPDRRGRRAAVRRTAFARGRLAGWAGDKRLGQPRYRPDPHRGHFPGNQGPRCTRYGGPRPREDCCSRGEGGVGGLWRLGPVGGPLARSSPRRSRHKPPHARHALRHREPALPERGCSLDALQLYLLCSLALPLLQK